MASTKSATDTLPDFVAGTSCKRFVTSRTAFWSRGAKMIRMPARFQSLKGATNIERPLLLAVARIALPDCRGSQSSLHRSENQDFTRAQMIRGGTRHPTKSGTRPLLKGTNVRAEVAFNRVNREMVQLFNTPPLVSRPVDFHREWLHCRVLSSRMCSPNRRWKCTGNEKP